MPSPALLRTLAASTSTSTFAPVRRVLPSTVLAASAPTTRRWFSSSRKSKDTFEEIYGDLVGKDVKAKEAERGFDPRRAARMGGYGSTFSDGSRRKKFVTGDRLRPVDLKPSNLLDVSKPFPKKPLPPTLKQSYYTDPFQRFSLNPLNEPHNPHLLIPYLSELGRIQSRASTGLSMKSQRRVGKAIRRARNMGFLPYFGKVVDGVAARVENDAARPAVESRSPLWMLRSGR